MATTTTTPVVPTVANPQGLNVDHELHQAQLVYATTIANAVLANRSSAKTPIDIAAIQVAEQMLSAIDLALPILQDER